RPAVTTKLDAFKPIIRLRLEAYPELSAVRLLEEIRAAGYDGGYTQLKEFVRSIRPVVAPQPVMRFETPPGRQAQIDFARFRFPWGALRAAGRTRLLAAALAALLPAARHANAARRSRGSVQLLRR